LPIDPASPAPRPCPGAIALKIVVRSAPDRRFMRSRRGDGRAATIVGVGRGQANLDDAMSLGIVDRVVTGCHWAAEVADADLVLLAAPVPSCRALRSVGGCLGPQTVVTDTGAQAGCDCSRTRPPGCRIVPVRSQAPDCRHRAHRRESRIRALFRGAISCWAPLPYDGSLGAWRIMARCGRWSGAQAGVHDRIFAAYHLPHLLALLGGSSRCARRRVLRYAASSRFTISYELAPDVARHRTVQPGRSWPRWRHFVRSSIGLRQCRGGRRGARAVLAAPAAHAVRGVRTTGRRSRSGRWTRDV
jgi:hypothetical protein